MTDQEVAILIGAVCLVCVVLVYLLFRYSDYRLSRHEVEVLLFDRVLRSVPLVEIDDVQVGARFPCELWPSPWVFRGRFLTIRRKHGLLRYLVICPKHPEKLRAHIFYALGWNPGE